MAALKDRLQEDIKTAMRERQKERLSVLRLIAAAIKQREVDDRISLTDEQTVAVVEKMIKQQRDALVQFEAAKRDDLVEKSRFELDILQNYMPPAIDEDTLDKLIRESINAAGAVTAADMGKVMAILKPKVQGRCDMGMVSKRVKHHLAQ